MKQMQILQKMSDLLPEVWEVVSETVSASSPVDVRFESPIAMQAAPQDVIAELSGNMLMIQFAMASHPGSMQAILIRPDMVLDIAKKITGTTFEEVDENVLTEIRPFAESIVQGLCLGLSQAVKETVVATGMAVRYQMLQLPDNIQTAASLVRVQVAMSMENISGVVLYLIDEETTEILTGIGNEEEEEFDENPFPQVGAAGTGGSPRNELEGGMEVLLDVPLEISVELGRKKMMVREVLDLGTGSIIEVDKTAGEPVDVMVNGRLVARGEVVVIEDNFGVRITEVLNPSERFRLEAA